MGEAVGAAHLRRLSPFFVKTRAIGLAGSGLGLGYLPWAPGTWGSLGGLLLWWLTLPLGSTVQALLLILLVGPATWICGECERNAGRTDPSFIVLDEVLGMYLAVLFLSPSLPWIFAAFAVFRLFDILKPWPVSLMEKCFSGGAAIMLDDLMAGALSAFILLLFQIFIMVS